MLWNAFYSTLHSSRTSPLPPSLPPSLHLGVLGAFSMYPLLERDGLTSPYWATLLLHRWERRGGREGERERWMKEKAVRDCFFFLVRVMFTFS